jgi:hypothetical protein
VRQTCFVAGQCCFVSVCSFRSTLLNYLTRKVFETGVGGGGGAGGICVSIVVASIKRFTRHPSLHTHLKLSARRFVVSRKDGAKIFNDGPLQQLDVKKGKGSSVGAHFANIDGVLKVQGMWWGMISQLSLSSASTAGRVVKPFEDRVWPTHAPCPPSPLHTLVLPHLFLVEGGV